MTKSEVLLWLRDESKPLEKRSPLTPTTVKKLLERGFRIVVERSKDRIFKDDEFESIEGVKMMPSGSWVNDAPDDAIVFGLKELNENDNFPLKHEHIHFAHCFKNQTNWKHILRRFKEGSGKLYDIEFLKHENGVRVAAFGYYAGFGGCAIALQVWAHQILHPNEKLKNLEPYENQELLISSVSADVRKAIEISGTEPRTIVIGSKGRCGRGAIDFLKACKLSTFLEWDLEETKNGGPFQEIADSHIFINCIYLKDQIPPFITREVLEASERKLSVICDVSCDYTNPFNPIPLYNSMTSFTDPTISVEGFHSPPLEVISIDHIPTYLPREASEQFSQDFLPTVFLIPNRSTDPIWQGALKVFNEKVALL